MKKLMMMFVVVLFGFQTVAQKGQPILPYGDYTVEEVRAFALSDSKKADKFRQALILIVNKQLKRSGENYIVDNNNISWIFDQVEEQEAWLDAKQWKNSRWLKNDSLDFYLSKSRYEGNCGIFDYGKCTFPLYKVSCANLIDPIIRKTTQFARVPKKINVTPGRIDTIYQEIWIQNPEQTPPVVVEINHYGGQQGYHEDFYYSRHQSFCFIPVMFSFPLISWGRNYSCNSIRGIDYYYNNQVTNNVTNINNNNISNTNTNINNYPNPNPVVDNGGPGGADTQPASPGGANTNNQGGGPGGAVTNNNSNPAGANTRGANKSVSTERSNSGRRSTSFSGSSRSSSLKSIRTSSVSRSSGYRTSSRPRSSSYRTSSSRPRSSSYRSSSSSRGSSYRASTTPNRSSSYRSSSPSRGSSRSRYSGSYRSSRSTSSMRTSSFRGGSSRSFSGGSSRSSGGSSRSSSGGRRR